MKILVTGASGFIGSHLVSRLSCLGQHEIVCMTRNVRSLDGRFNGQIKIIKADVGHYTELLKAMTGVDVAFYLIHSMEGSSKEWKQFAKRDRIAAENFAKAATECEVKRIIYLGGLSNEENIERLSGHMRSRIQVGEILKTSSAKVTIFRAAVILGQGGGSFQMLQYLVERLPIMVCPKWVLTKSQPIAVDDVVSYLIKAIDSSNTEDRAFDIGGPDVLSYLDMMKRYGKMINKSIKIIIIPFLTPRLSSYWIDLITPLKASLARPLIDSLKHEATTKDDTIREIIPLQLKSFEDAIKAAKEEEQKPQKKTTKNERTSISINNKVLLISLFAISLMGLTYYVLYPKPEVFLTNWIILSVLWYFGIAFSIYFIMKSARLGSMIAGIIGWATLAFWLTDSVFATLGNSFHASSNIVTNTRDFISIAVAGLVVIASHNVFHKLRVYQLS